MRRLFKRIIAWVRRLPRATRTPPNEPAPAPPTRLLIVDGTDAGRGHTLLAMLRDVDLPFELVDRIAPAYGLVLLLPITAGPREPAALSDLAGDLESFARVAPTTGRLVVAWYVEDDARRQLGLPEREEGGIHNATALLLGTAWRRELAAHQGDPGAAAACRSRALRAMLDAPNNQAVGGAQPRAVHRDAERLDPNFLIALCSQIAVDPADADSHRWTGAAGVVAAVQSRLAT